MIISFVSIVAHTPTKYLRMSFLYEKTALMSNDGVLLLKSVSRVTRREYRYDNCMSVFLSCSIEKVVKWSRRVFSVLVKFGEIHLLTIKDTEDNEFSAIRLRVVYILKSSDSPSVVVISVFFVDWYYSITIYNALVIWWLSSKMKYPDEVINISWTLCSQWRSDIFFGKYVGGEKILRHE